MNIAQWDKYFDKRGHLYTAWDEGLKDKVWVQDRVSVSKFKVLRGFHTDNITTKYIYLPYGRARFVVYNLDTKEKVDITLCGDDTKCTVLIVEPRELLAHQCLSLDCVMVYKWSHAYAGPENQISVSPFDPEIGITWELEPILSDRDKGAKTIREQRL